jgi:hypothetical protein
VTEIVPVRLSLGELNTITEGDTLWVVFRPAVEALGLNVKTQIDKVKSRSWACVSLRDMQVPGDTQVRRHLVVDRRTLTMWLATVNENNVPEEKRQQLITFQREAADALDRHFHEGAALNPRAVDAGPAAALPPGESFTPKTFPFVDAVVLIRQQFGVRISVNDLTETLRQGGVLRQDERRPKAQYEALFWNTGSAYEIFAHAIEPIYRLYEATKIRLEMAAQTRLPADPPGWPELPLNDADGGS